jgi:hypothetical protein
MYVSEPFIDLTHGVAPVSARAGLRGLAALFAIGLVLFVVMLAATLGITDVCPAPRAGPPVHLAR